MMLMRVIVVLLLGCGPLTAYADSSKKICGPLPPEALELAMEAAPITESDLTATAVREAISTLELTRNASWGGGHHEHLAAGALRIIEGYALKYRAEFVKSAMSVKEFCRWLATEAYWPE